MFLHSLNHNYKPFITPDLTIETIRKILDSVSGCLLCHEIRRELEVQVGWSSKGVGIGDFRSIRGNQGEDNTIKCLGDLDFPLQSTVLSVLVGTTIDGDEDGIETRDESGEVGASGRESGCLNGESGLLAWGVGAGESKGREGFETRRELGSIAGGAGSDDTRGDGEDLADVERGLYYNNIERSEIG